MSATFVIACCPIPLHNDHRRMEAEDITAYVQQFCSDPDSPIFHRVFGCPDYPYDIVNIYEESHLPDIHGVCDLIEEFLESETYQEYRAQERKKFTPQDIPQDLRVALTNSLADLAVELFTDTDDTADVNGYLVTGGYSHGEPPTDSFNLALLMDGLELFHPIGLHTRIHHTRVMDYHISSTREGEPVVDVSLRFYDRDALVMLSQMGEEPIAFSLRAPEPGTRSYQAAQKDDPES